MLAKDILRIVLYGVGLSSLGAVIYFAGPFIAFGDWRPLENHIVRQIAILLLTTVVAGIVGLNLFKRRTRAKEIAFAREHSAKPQAVPADLRGYFARGGSLTLKIEKWDQQSLVATSPLFGKTTFSPRAFTRLEFLEKNN